MDPERWRQLRELFDAALPLPAPERAELVARSCEGDPDLQRTLESLLEHSLDTGASFERALDQAIDPGGSFAKGRDLVGRTLGRYRIHEKIGEGGMGEVYRATDTSLGRDVAIKIVPEHFARDPERLARFEREARALASLSHPSIATIHGIEQAEGIRFLVLELLGGETLRARLERGPLAIQEVVRLAEEIASGLAQAHEARIVHRDLKPDNLMLTEEGAIKILDFGLAKTTSGGDDGKSSDLGPEELETRTGHVLGTTPYMSPEQARGEPVDHRSDQFAFGSVLFEMATGRRAFRRGSEADTLSAILGEEPERPADFETAVPAALRLILERCLAKNRRDRYDSTRDLLGDLRALDASRPTVDELAATREQPRSSSAKGPLWPVALVALALVTVGALWWWTRRGAGEDLARLAPLTAVATGSASIAVLPLENLGPADEQYFADGMTDALITQLSKIGALKVISRTSIMPYRDTQKSLPEIARELGVATVLTGSVFHAGDRVRISTQLIDAATDENLWAESYDKDLIYILELQSQVAQAIAGAVKVEINPQEKARIADSRRLDPEAHDAYLRGLALLGEASQGTADNEEIVSASFAEFQRAIELEPEWAQPWAELAGAYARRANMGGVAVQSEFYPRAKAAAQHALELDDNLAGAHAVLGRVLLEHEWDWDAAEAAFERARALGARGTVGWARYLSRAGRWDEAIAEYGEILERDPASAGFRYQRGAVYLCASRLDQAEAEARGLIEAGDVRQGNLLLGQVLIHRGDYEEVLAQLEEELGYWAENRPWFVGLLPYAQAKSGRREEAREALRELEASGYEWFPEPLVALGEEEKAMAQIEAAFETRRDVLLGLPCSPEYDRLMELPRFREIVDAIGFPR